MWWPGFGPSMKDSQPVRLPAGSIEYLSRAGAKGWVTRGGVEPVRVQFLYRGEVMAEALADRQRPEAGERGFELRSSQQLAPEARLEDIELCIVGGDELAFAGPPILQPTTMPAKPVHRRIRVPLYASPFVEQLMEEDDYTQAQRVMVREFAERGLVKFRLGRKDFPELARAIIGDAEKLYAGALRYQDAWSLSAPIRELACDAEVAQVLRVLYGRPAIPMQTLNFPCGTQQPTHVDTVHFNSQPGHFMCGVWVALEPITQANGPLHYFPGSHLLPILDYDSIGVAVEELFTPENWWRDYGYHQDVLHALIEVKKLPKEVLHADKGEAIIWAANLLHGGELISQPGSSRHSQVTHFYFEGCSYYTPSLSNIHMNRFHRANRRDIRTGEPLRHYFEELPLPWGPSE
jgi:hypothetical protein